MEHDVVSMAYQRFSITLKQTGRNEYHSSCPECGGKKRFVVWDKGNYWCRECGFSGWLQERDKTWKIDPVLREQHAREIERLRQERKQEQEKLVASWQDGFNTGYIQGWHDAMRQGNRDFWLAQGILEQNIDRYSLGYCPSKKVYVGENLINIPAYTIPITDPTTNRWVNVQYRLVDPPKGVGKYRQEKDLPAAAFYANSHLDGDCIIVEGAKKAIVVSQLICDGIQVVGLPGISPNQQILEKLKGFKRKWLIPDPDVKSETIRKLVGALGNTRSVTLPDKIDDCILKYGLDQHLLRRELKFARAF